MRQVELRLSDKAAALEKLGRHLGMFDKGPEGDQGGLTIRVVHE